jgi:hypothetical protein
VLEIPLYGPEAVALDLQAAFAATYARSGYGRGRMYRHPVEPPLSPAEQSWVEERLAAWRAEAAEGA